MTQTTQALEDRRDYIKTAERIIDRLENLLPALQDWHDKGRKTITIKFNKEYFEASNQGYGYDYELKHDPSYFGKDYYIYITHNHKIESDSRDTAEILEVVKKDLENHKRYLQQYQDELAALESFNEEAFISDIKALYIKHGQPTHWTKLLGSYAVKYPNN